MINFIMKKKYNKTRRFVFTINNYTKKEKKQFVRMAMKLKKHRYILFAFEIGDKKKTPHIQGYIELTEHQQFTFLHNYFNLQRKSKKLKFHIQEAKADQKKNYEYISKDGNFYEFGKSKDNQGKRNDILEIKKELLKNPKNYKSIIIEKANTSPSLNYAEKFLKYIFTQRDIKSPPVVLWIYGDTGIGKTKIVFDTFKSICTVGNYKWIGTNYSQNEVLLFDDFRSEDLSFHKILKITDKYPLTLDVKNSNIELNSPYIIFTSSKSINKTFNQESKKENLEQLKRRIHEIDLKNEKDVDLKKYKPKLAKK